MLKVNGNLLYIQKKYLVDKLGEDRLREFLEKASSETKEVYSGAILSSKWYPQKYYEEILELMEARFGIGEIDKYSAWIAEKQLVGFYGMVAKFLSINRITTLAQKYWDKLYDEGKVTVLENEKDHIKAQIEDIILSDLYVYSLMMYLKRWVELSQKTDVKAHWKRMHESGFTIEFNF